MNIIRKWLKKLIHECLTERFGCVHEFGKMDENGFRQCKKCQKTEYDSMGMVIRKITYDGVKMR